MCQVSCQRRSKLNNFTPNLRKQFLWLSFEVEFKSATQDMNHSPQHLQGISTTANNWTATVVLLSGSDRTCRRMWRTLTLLPEKPTNSRSFNVRVGNMEIICRERWRGQQQQHYWWNVNQLETIKYKYVYKSQYPLPSFKNIIYVYMRIHCI